jgi:hypothetical protein
MGITPHPANGLRHSFCSYHLAMYENSAKTAYLVKSGVERKSMNVENRTRVYLLYETFGISPRVIRDGDRRTTKIGRRYGGTHELQLE